ncbi:helix-turn-helix transcriptional regulator [Micrococcus sp. EYE_162]|uniref:helix-turn-helix domain-containing protein n=1 Tax=unclassified Micrococcus TaxID=2620948 RepID=UPI002006334D|nr:MULTISPECIES: helix-turn-helix transcriptional regulator [unclassified Micrococcus]MCK6096255.1 helix-turn-helix transcriptional regulator [Micrococcus sp. EYE_212]MCK6171899.1 helix-turn-helix transcriptional regulator [Micrococcus sp. EYE_162]
MTKQKQLTLQIRSRLALADKTLSDLGEALGLGRAAMSARMNGHRDFSFSELELVADFLGVQMRDLFAFEDAAVAR